MTKSLNIVRTAGLLAVLLISSGAAATDLATAEDARDRALRADAPALAADEWKRAEKSLDKARKRADGRSSAERISAAFTTATQDYDAAELEAISAALLDPARRALRAAEDARAERYAPATYAGAEAALQEAGEAIVADRYATETITGLVEQARFEAAYAMRLARIIEEKPATENLLRDRDFYLFALAQAARTNFDLEQDTETAVEALTEDIGRLYAEEQRLRGDLEDSQTFIAALEEEIRELDAQLGGASQERKQLVMELETQARSEEKFRQTEGLFDESEAEVFRQSETIVIRLFGLEFESGSADLDAGNDALLAKVGQAVELYSRAAITVEGHTDSQGSTRLNQRLSQNRADAVADYMIANMKIAPNLVDAIGFGASRPIANNETQEGRARNRRIDLIIRP